MSDEECFLREYPFSDKEAIVQSSVKIIPGTHVWQTKTNYMEGTIVENSKFGLRTLYGQLYRRMHGVPLKRENDEKRCSPFSREHIISSFLLKKTAVT